MEDTKEERDPSRYTAVSCAITGRKVAFFAFRGEPMCFAHALLNALDMHERGHDVKLVIEGTATGAVKELSDPEKPFANIFRKAKDAGIIDCVCKACAGKTGSLESVEGQGLPLCGEMSGHPAMARYMEEGYEIIVL